jgi:hypothetical protein
METPFSQNHEVDRRDRRFGALRRGINGQTAPARPWPDEKPAESQGWPRMDGPAAYVADPCDVSDCLDDDRGSRTCRNGGGCTRREPGASSS